MKKIIPAISVLLSFLIIFAGCASIVSKSNYPVQVNSQPSNIDFVITDEKDNEIFSGKTPTIVNLDTKAGYFSGKNYRITFNKAGNELQTTQIKRSIDLWYALGNLVFGGLIGYLIVDPLTGAMWKLEDVNVSLPTDSETSALDINSENKSYFIVTTLDQVPLNLQSKLVPIN